MWKQATVRRSVQSSMAGLVAGGRGIIGGISRLSGRLLVKVR